MAALLLTSIGLPTTWRWFPSRNATNRFCRSFHAETTCALASIQSTQLRIRRCWTARAPPPRSVHHARIASTLFSKTSRNHGRLRGRRSTSTLDDGPGSNTLPVRERKRPDCRYESDDNWEKQLHESLGVPWPCKEAAEFWALWPEVIRELEAKGIRPGPESFQAWNDGDAGLVRAIWCLIRHMRPKKIVETGVAHGVTSRCILEALARNGDGHLWSIDLPPLESHWRKQVAAAVGDRHADRWSYIEGSSRRRLPELLSRLGKIDLFVHDSLHSERNVRFELDRAWVASGPNAALVVDDVDANWGFRSFTQAFPVSNL